jgi:hypothetical protein
LRRTTTTDAACLWRGIYFRCINANNPDIAYGIEVWLGMARILNSWTGSDGGIA